MLENKWFDELEWQIHTHNAVDDDGNEVGGTMVIHECVYGENEEYKNMLIMTEHVGMGVTQWVAVMWEFGPAPVVVDGRGAFESVDEAKSVMKEWFRKGNPVQRWTDHTAQRRTRGG